MLKVKFQPKLLKLKELKFNNRQHYSIIRKHKKWIVMIMTLIATIWFSSYLQGCCLCKQCLRVQIWYSIIRIGNIKLEKLLTWWNRMRVEGKYREVFKSRFKPEIMKEVFRLNLNWPIVDLRVVLYKFNIKVLKAAC